MTSYFAAGAATRVDLLLLISIAMVFTFYKTTKCDPGYIPISASPRDEYRVSHAKLISVIGSPFFPLEHIHAL